MKEKLLDESNKLEYKRDLPKDNIKWLKTIVSFSNTAGGQLLIGIEDSTKKVVGINTSRSVLESRIMDAIYNNIQPVPIVNIIFKNIENKDVLIVQVARGNETPYYIKKLGKIEGTYVRFGSTDRVATQSQKEELVLISKRKSYTGEIYYNSNNERHLITREELSSFLEMINNKNILKEINEDKLLEWGLIDEIFEENYATNGYMLLKCNPFPYSYIKLGQFKGKTKAGLFYEENITGSIIKQYEDIVEKIKEILNEGYSFKKIRTKNYLIPEEVIREIIANAVIHRDYNDKHPIRVEIFNDRMSIYSPGSLFDGIQLEDMISGVSKLRNKNIAEIFHSLGFIEKWGSGIQRANKALLDNQMNELKIYTESIHGVSVEISFEKNVSIDALKDNEIPTLEQVLNYYINQDSNFTRRKVEQDFGITERQARTIIEELTEENLIEKVGKGRATHYIIIED